MLGIPEDAREKRCTHTREAPFQEPIWDGHRNYSERETGRQWQKTVPFFPVHPRAFRGPEGRRSGREAGLLTDRGYRGVSIRTPRPLSIST